MLRPTLTPLLSALALVLAGLTGCSGDDGCAGATYEVDRSAAGAPSPIRAVETWLGDPGGAGDFGDQPPTDGWFVLQTGESRPTEVVVTNDAGNGWWVQAVRTDDGGYVVAQATDDRAACEDELG